MVFTACGHLKDLLVVELDAGDDLLIKISEACEAAGIKNGFVYDMWNTTCPSGSSK